MKQSAELLTELSNAHAVPGMEQEVRQIFKQRLNAAGTLEIDRIGNVYCQINNADHPHCVVDCHMDEVGFMVQSITPDGFLRVVGLGGWSALTLPSQPVVVIGGSGKIPGVFGSVPPHFQKSAAKENPKLEDLYIDIGATDADMVRQWGIRPGSFVCPDTKLQQTHHDKRLIGKAFDNRVGCGICIESALALKDAPIHATFVGSVQEEGGLRGATISSRLCDADVAIVLEGTPADDTPGGAGATAQGKLGKGVQIRCFDPTHVANAQLVDWAVGLAEKKSIPFQLAVRRSGGTNAGRYHLASKGIPTLVLGVPSRYIHSHRSMIDLDDYVATRELCIELVKALNADLLKAILPSLV